MGRVLPCLWPHPRHPRTNRPHTDERLRGTGQRGLFGGGDLRRGRQRHRRVVLAHLRHGYRHRRRCASSGAGIRAEDRGLEPVAHRPSPGGGGAQRGLGRQDHRQFPDRSDQVHLQVPAARAHDRRGLRGRREDRLCGLAGADRRHLPAGRSQGHWRRGLRFSCHPVPLGAGCGGRCLEFHFRHLHLHRTPGGRRRRTDRPGDSESADHQHPAGSVCHRALLLRRGYHLLRGGQEATDHPGRRDLVGGDLSLHHAQERPGQAAQSAAVLRCPRGTTRQPDRLRFRAAQDPRRRHEPYPVAARESVRLRRSRDSLGRCGSLAADQIGGRQPHGRSLGSLPDGRKTLGWVDLRGSNRRGQGRCHLRRSQTIPVWRHA